MLSKITSVINFIAKALNVSQKSIFADIVDLILMMIKRMAAKNTTWYDVFRLKYAQIRPENSFWCPPAFQLKIFVEPSGDHYAQDQAKMT